MTDDEAPIAEPAAEPVAAAEVVEPPVAEPPPTRVAEPMTEPAPEPIPAPTAEPAAEPVVAAPPEPVAEPVAAAAPEAVAPPVGTSSTDSVSSRSIRNIVVRVGAELGRATLPLSKAVGLAPGSVIELDRAADDPIDLYVNGRRFATGQLLLVDQTDWAIRIDHVLDVEADPMDFVPSGEDLI